jgi:site-specific recombinase XerD
MEKRRHTPFAANNFLKTMRALFRWAVDADLVNADPTTGVKMFSKQTDGFVAWTEDNVAAYQETWPLGTRERLAMELLLHTGFRRGDIVRVGRQHIREGFISLVTEKTGERVDIPLRSALKAVI